MVSQSNPAEAITAIGEQTSLQGEDGSKKFPSGPIEQATLTASTLGDPKVKPDQDVGLKIIPDQDGDPNCIAGADGSSKVIPDKVNGHPKGIAGADGGLKVMTDQDGAKWIPTGLFGGGLAGLIAPGRQTASKKAAPIPHFKVISSTTANHRRGCGHGEDENTFPTQVCGEDFFTWTNAPGGLAACLQGDSKFISGLIPPVGQTASSHNISSTTAPDLRREWGHGEDREANTFLTQVSEDDFVTLANESPDYARTYVKESLSLSAMNIEDFREHGHFSNRSSGRERGTRRSVMPQEATQRPPGRTAGVLQKKAGI